jgi:hypothetical protein
MARILKVFSGASLLCDLPASGVDIPKTNAGPRPALRNTMRRRHAPRSKCRAATRESMHRCFGVSGHGNDRVTLFCCSPPTNIVTLCFHPFLTFLDTSSLAHRGFAAVCFAVRTGQFATSLQPGGHGVPVHADRVASAIRPLGAPEILGPAATFRPSPRAA